jgi:hemolysin activation/secretion protein
VPTPGANHFDQRNGFGVAYHKFLLTPYWDPEGGVALDANYQYGVEVFGQHQDYHLGQGQFSTVKSFPEALLLGSDDPVSQWLKETRFAFRVAAGAGSRSNGQFFSLGGGDQFRGFDTRERQGSLTWVSSVEWRVPVVQNTPWDFCDKIIGIRNIYLAPFYDVGNAYLRNHQVGDTAHAVGLGLRVDVQWLSIIERTMLRFDVAKTVNADTPVQFWFGVQHPF